MLAKSFKSNIQGFKFPEITRKLQNFAFASSKTPLLELRKI
jgi:hypothetical protein